MPTRKGSAITRCPYIYNGCTVTISLRICLILQTYDCTPVLLLSDWAIVPIVFPIRPVIHRSPFQANSLLFNSYRPQHICMPLLMTQILSSWPDLPTFSFMAYAQPCLYINDQYFNSQALSLTWFPIQCSWKLPSVTSSLSSKLRVVSSSTRDFYLFDTHHYKFNLVQVILSRLLGALTSRLQYWLIDLCVLIVPSTL